MFSVYSFSVGILREPGGMLRVAYSRATDGRCGVFGRVALAPSTSYGCWQEIVSAPVLDTKGEVLGRTLLFSWEPGRMVSLVQTV